MKNLLGFFYSPLSNDEKDYLKRIYKDDLIQHAQRDVFKNHIEILSSSILYKIKNVKNVRSFNLTDYNNDVRKCSFKQLERVFTDKKNHDLAKTLYPKVLLWKDDFNDSYQIYTQLTKNLSLLKFGVLYEVDENGEHKLFDPVNTFRQEWQEKTLINIVNNDIFDDVMSDDSNERVKVVKSLMHSFSLDFNLDNVLKVSKAMV